MKTIQQSVANLLNLIASAFYVLGNEEHCDDDPSKPRNSKLVRIGDWLEGIADRFDLKLQEELRTALKQSGGDQ